MIYRPQELLRQPREKVAEMLKSDHCLIYDAAKLYRRGEMKGTLKLLKYTPNAMNVMTTATKPAGSTEFTGVRQIVRQEYFLRGKQQGMIHCHTFLNSDSGTEASQKVEAYTQAGPYAPLMSELAAQ